MRNHKAVTRPASSLAQDRESLPGETTVLRRPFSGGAKYTGVENFAIFD